MTQYPEYTPASSGRELGIMFAFIGACLVTMGIYSFIWRGVQRRAHAEDLGRRKALKNGSSMPGTLAAADGLHLGNTTTVAAGPGAERMHEKMMDRYAVAGDRAELAVHGMARGERAKFGGRGDLL
ncbi:uncharacterized protein N7482_006698 [Penicillium canariense]|uniref:Uncharacterized protein n=1 Tax=Penicillium canariense TaxID=189055 RepID=A0A9W9LJE4_9EURO|nr:uncharacterized protein N7482_006698 [Penicillium canariense]KAJ5159694.1 hypothetical protein N7482_006698 [Penicillium canariense]